MTRREAERLQRLLAEGSPADDAATARDEASGRELAGLTSLARTLESSAAEPGPAFPDALRERVLATAAEEPPVPWRARVGTIVDDLVAAWRISTRSPTASGALTLVLLLAALFAGASLSLPGDPLYAIKDAYQQAQLARASAPTDIASVKLDLASAKIDETVRAAERDRPESLVTSAHDAEALVRDSAETLLTAFHDTGEADLLVPLATFVDGHRPTVAEVRDRVADPEAEQALAELMSTLEGVDAEVSDILGSCCEPPSDTGAYWMISSPQPVVDRWPSLPAPDDEAGPDPGTGSVSGDDTIELLPRSEGTDSDGPSTQLPERLRDGFDRTRERVDDTTDRVTDGVDETTEDTSDTVKETTDGVTDTVDESTDGVTDTVDETTDGTTEGVTEGVDDAVDQTTDAVDETLDETTDSATDAIDETTDTANDAVEGVVGDTPDSQSSGDGADGRVGGDSSGQSADSQGTDSQDSGSQDSGADSDTDGSDTDGDGDGGGLLP